MVCVCGMHSCHPDDHIKVMAVYINIHGIGLVVGIFEGVARVPTFIIRSCGFGTYRNSYLIMMRRCDSS